MPTHAQESLFAVGTSCAASRSFVVAVRCLKMPPALSPRRRPLRHQFGCCCFGGDSIEEGPVPQRAGSFPFWIPFNSSVHTKPEPSHARAGFIGAKPKLEKPHAPIGLGGNHRRSHHGPDHFRRGGKARKQRQQRGRDARAGPRGLRGRLTRRIWTGERPKPRDAQLPLLSARPGQKRPLLKARVTPRRCPRPTLALQPKRAGQSGFCFVQPIDMSLHRSALSGTAPCRAPFQ
jgi:hypothetical protein